MKHLLNLSLFLVTGLLIVSSCKKEKEEDPDLPKPPEMGGIVINGVRWATCNVDMPGTFAAHPEDAGMFYQWNRKVGWSSTNPLVNSDGGTTWDNTYPPVPPDNIWAQENDPCPLGWRVPTLEELRSLEKAKHYYGELNGVSGRFFGDNNKRLFLPAVGYRDVIAGALLLVKDGYYWGSTVNSQTFNAHGMGFDSTKLWIGSDKRIYGFCVRCVAAENTSAHR